MTRYATALTGSGPDIGGTDNLIANVIATVQDVVAQVPELVQPLIIAAAAAIPFVEGELAAMVGIVGGLHPVVAWLAAVTGNLLCVVLVVFLASRARGAIVNRSRRGKASTETSMETGMSLGAPAATMTAPAPAAAKPTSKGRERFQRWFVRFGVPGASILGPLAIPTQFTAATLVASGVSKGRIILWQAVAIMLWTTVTTVSASIAIAVATR